MSDPTHNIIVWWWGLQANIPDGWKLCDGNNNTPDLRFKFIVGAGGAKAVDATGGIDSHSHAFTGDNHAHRIRVGSYIQAGSDYDRDTQVSPVIGNTGGASHLPPWMNLFCIKKD